MNGSGDSPGTPGRSGDGLTVALAVESEDWLDPALGLGDVEALERLVEASARAALRAAGAAPAGARTELSVTLGDDALSQETNRAWRGKDRPTNVLSFPMKALVPGERPGPLLGDLLLALETLRREAAEEEKPLADHLRHLLVHGTLHCLGFDHETDAEAERMERMEREVLAGLGVPDPYGDTDPIERTEAAGGRPGARTRAESQGDRT